MIATAKWSFRVDRRTWDVLRFRSVFRARLMGFFDGFTPFHSLSSLDTHTHTHTHGAPEESSGAIGWFPSCARLDTLAAASRADCCANTVSSFRTLKGATCTCVCVAATEHQNVTAAMRLWLRRRKKQTHQNVFALIFKCDCGRKNVLQ